LRTNARERAKISGAGGWWKLPNEKSIENAKPDHGLLGIAKVGGAPRCHIQKLRIVPLKMPDDFRHAGIGPAGVELPGDLLPSFLGDAGKHAHSKNLRRKPDLRGKMADTAAKENQIARHIQHLGRNTVLSPTEAKRSGTPHCGTQY
jgi:hypothetical protein